MNSVWWLALADWLINLSAGWSAAGLAVIVTSREFRKINLWLLTSNLLFAILSLVLAVKLRGG